jgi:superfamily II DNA or RNA helicase
VSTPLFFAQAVGRFVRARRRGETASVFLPSVAPLLQFAGEMEVERDHALDRPRRDDDEDLWAPEEDLLAAARARRDTPGDEQLPFEALEAEASFDRVLFDGGEFGSGLGAAVGSEEEQDFLGLPGLLEPDQVTTLLQARQSKHQAARARRAPVEPEAVPTHVRQAALRRELNGLVGAWHHRTGTPHASIHAELRRVCGGPPAARATIEQLQGRIDLIRRWATSRTR